MRKKPMNKPYRPRRTTAPKKPIKGKGLKSFGKALNKGLKKTKILSTATRILTKPAAKGVGIAVYGLTGSKVAGMVASEATGALGKYGAKKIKQKGYGMKKKPIVNRDKYGATMWTPANMGGPITSKSLTKLKF